LRGEGVGGRGRTSSFATPHTHLPKAQGSTKWVGRVALITRKENHNQGNAWAWLYPRWGGDIYGRGTLAKKVGQIIPRGSVADERKPRF